MKEKNGAFEVLVTERQLFRVFKQKDQGSKAGSKTGPNLEVLES